MSIALDLKKRLRVPVIASPLFIISIPDLVIAQCKAGIIGSFPALNARPASLLDEWLERITTELAEHDRQFPDRPAAPFAVNQIVHRSNARLEHDLEVCAKYKVPIVITSLGALREHKTFPASAAGYQALLAWAGAFGGAAAGRRGGHRPPTVPRGPGTCGRRPAGWRRCPSSRPGTGRGWRGCTTSKPRTRLP